MFSWTGIYTYVDDKIPRFDIFVSFSKCNIAHRQHAGEGV